MIHSNNKFGFSLLETIVAMTIIAFMVSPLVIMQGSVLRRVIRDSDHEDRIFLMRNFLYEARHALSPGATTFTFEKKVTDPNTQLRYQLMPPKENSSLQAMKGIHLERVTATWREAGKEQQDVMVTTVYIEPEAPKAQT